MTYNKIDLIYIRCYNNNVKLFNISFGNNMRGTEELFRRGKAEYDAKNGLLIIKKGMTVSFDTYFNLFPYDEYARYCGIDEVTLHIGAEGSYTLALYSKKKSGAGELIFSGQFYGNCDIKTNISGEKSGGYLYFTVTANTDCTIKDGCWGDERLTGRRVNMGIVICTYKREKFVKANMGRIAAVLAKYPEWKERLHVFIVDNASELQLEESDFYTVVPNRNLGGSGGFARGMLEISMRPQYTHMLLMDDDIHFDFNTLARTYYLLCALSDEHADASVGGAMLRIEHPCMQHEFGGTFKGLIFKPINTNLDMRLEKSLLKNQHAEKPDYHAWWYCCMPASFIKRYGLPMPFFIKSDDVEYSLRTFKDIIVMNGIAVWHQDFSDKYTGVLEYYLKRNSAIAAAIHSRGGRLEIATRFAYFMFKGISIRNYDSVELLYRAYLDFKKGPKFLMETDPEELNREIQAKSPVFVDKKQLEERFGKIDMPPIRDEKRHSVIASIVMMIENYTPAFMMSDSVGYTEIGNPRAMDSYMHKTVVHYDARGEKGLVFEFDAKRRAKLRRATWHAVFGILLGYSKIKRQYKKRYLEVCSEEHWRKLFFPDGDNIGTKN